MSKHKKEIDQNIVNALKKIKWPLINYQKRKVFIRKYSRNENGFEHIACKKHYLKVRDIEIIKDILIKPLNIVINKKGKSYFGIRKGINKTKYLKIVVRSNNNEEEIVTIYPNKYLKK